MQRELRYFNMSATYLTVERCAGTEGSYFRPKEENLTLLIHLSSYFIKNIYPATRQPCRVINVALGLRRVSALWLRQNMAALF